MLSIKPHTTAIKVSACGGKAQLTTVIQQTSIYVYHYIVSPPLATVGVNEKVRLVQYLLLIGRVCLVDVDIVGLNPMWYIFPSSYFEYTSTQYLANHFSQGYVLIL